MNKLKKLMAVLLAAVMTMATGVTAFAAPEQGTGSITINGTKEKGNIEAYRMFKAEVEQQGANSNSESVKYTLENGFEEFFKTEFSEMSSLEGIKLSDAAAEKLDEIQRGNAAGKVEFSKKVLTWVLKNAAKIQALKYTQTAAENSTTISGLPFGFYMVYTPDAGQQQTGNKDEKTPAMMVTVKDTTPVEVNLKSEYPTVEKTISPEIPDTDDVTMEEEGLQIGVDSSWDTIHENTIESVVDESKAGDFQVGDVVTFKLTAKVPDMTGFTDYTFKFNDTLSTGLTFKAIQKVTVGNTVIKPVQLSTAGNNTYSVTLKGQQLTITMNNFLQSYKDQVGQEITVYYKAMVNENAVVGMQPNTNKAEIEFSNDPTNNTTSKSEPDIVDVHTFDFSIHKFYKSQGENKNLAGAEFALYSDQTCITKINLKKLSNLVNTWVPSNDTLDEKIVTPSDGKVTVQGLKAGTYYLKETKAPEGYHLLKQPIKVVITPTYTGETGKLEKYTITYTYEGQETLVENNSNPLEVENKNGTILPNTGGMGTVVFTVVSVVLILGVAVSFIISRRKEEK